MIRLMRTVIVGVHSMNKEAVTEYITKWLDKFIDDGEFKIFKNDNLIKPCVYKCDVSAMFSDWLAIHLGYIGMKDDGFIIEFKHGKKASFKIERDIRWE